MIKRHIWLVFELPKNWSPSSRLENQVECTFANKSIIDHLFGKDKQRNKIFQRFLQRGFIGLFLHQGAEWISYSWMSLPYTYGPPHLYHSIQKLPVYWIFYCRTKENYRGRGFFKMSLNTLSHWARERERGAEIYIDTEPHNLPSRSAIIATGFVPRGVITSWAVRLPKLRIVLASRWELDAMHPEMRAK